MTDNSFLHKHKTCNSFFFHQRHTSFILIIMYDEDLKIKAIFWKYLYPIQDHWKIHFKKSFNNRLTWSTKYCMHTQHPDQMLVNIFFRSGWKGRWRVELLQENVNVDGEGRQSTKHNRPLRSVLQSYFRMQTA